MPIIATPLPTADLVSLGSVQAQLTSLTTAQAAALPALISAASQAVKTYCRRDFVPTDYTETFDSSGSGRLFLGQRPVNSIASIVVGTIAPTTLDPGTYRFNPKTGEVVGATGDSFWSYGWPGPGGGGGGGYGWGGWSPGGGCGGFQDIVVSYNAGYLTIPSDVQQAVIETIKSMLYSVTRNGQVSSETWGPHSISYLPGVASLIGGGVAADLLRNYVAFR